MAFEIRRIQTGDEPLFDRVAAEVFDEPVHPDRLRAYLAEPGHLMVVALKLGEVVGQVAAVIHRHPDKVTELYFDEVGTGVEHRRQGIAKAMVKAMLAWGRELGCQEAWLGTEPDNAAARALYASFKGEPAEDFVGYEFDLAKPLE